MTIKNKAIIGSDLCNCECIERDNIIHPETCLSQIKITDNTLTSLYSWINNNTNSNIEEYSSLKDWLVDNYPMSGTSIVPIATENSVGGVCVDTTYLNISNNGTLSVKVESLPIINEHCSSYNSLGSIKLGNDTVIQEDFANGTITESSFYKFPLRIDSNNRAGITIPISTFGAVQSNWNETNTSSPGYILNKPQILKSDWNEQDQTSNAFIRNKPTIPIVNDSVITFTHGNNTQTITLNQSNNSTIVLPEYNIEGRGIVSITKTSTVGNIDTYTILYTDSTSSTFNVTNGLNGANGADGNDGADGSDGISISSIQKTGTSGLVDTYTITLSNGNSSTFTVTNGADGTSFTLKGYFNSPAELPSSGQQIGDAYLVWDTRSESKHLWVYTNHIGTGGINGFEDYGEMQGPKGDNSYTHIVYASTNTPSSQNIHSSWQSGDIYIGIYSDNNATASTDYTSYVWSKFVGDNGNTPTIAISSNGTWIINGIDTQQQAIGINGTNGSTGPQGNDGNSIFIRYSANSDGSSMSPTYSSGHKYIGIYVGQSAPSLYTSYTWCKFIGDDGEAGTSSDINVVQTLIDDGYKPLLLSNVLSSGDSSTTCYSDYAKYDVSERTLVLKKENQNNNTESVMNISGNGIVMKTVSSGTSSVVTNKIITSNGLITAPPSGQTSYLKYSNGFTWDTNPMGNQYSPEIDEIYYDHGAWTFIDGSTTSITSAGDLRSLIANCSEQNNKFTIFINVDSDDSTTIGNDTIIQYVINEVINSLNNNKSKHSVDVFINHEEISVCVNVLSNTDCYVFESNRNDSYDNYYNLSTHELNIAKDSGAKLTFSKLNFNQEDNKNTLWITYFSRKKIL